jgi:hypothetical protein
MWIRILLSAILMVPVAALAQHPGHPASPDPNQPAQTQPTDGFLTFQEIVTGGTFGADESSAKFNEYRDVDDGLYLFALRLLGYSNASGLFLESVGSNLGRDDQYFALRTGQYNSWSAAVEVDSLPHRISNNAFSPYSYAGNGLYTVPGVVGILTSTADNVNFRAADMLENDRRIAAYLDQNLRPLPQIGTDNDRLGLFLSYAPVASVDARLSAVRETRQGDKITYGPLGDRPPRTMNVELTEPIDYNETTLQFDFGYAHRLFDMQFELFAPRFSNRIDTMQWQSMYFGRDSDGALDYNNDIILAGDAIVRRAVSTVGQRALPPDSNMTNATLAFGFDTAMNGRFTATAAVGRMRQDMTLLPYSYSSLTTNWNQTSKLPRLTADAAMDTLLLDLQYVFLPMRGLRVRPFFRSYDLQNDTPSDNWWYVTQDASNNTSGGATYKNKRTNLAYDFSRRNAGVEATWQARRLNLGATVEQESVDRDFREANTDELILRASASYRPVRWISLRGRYTFGDRDAGTYNDTVTRQTYWYAPGDVGADQDNPGFTFTNHPDMRRYDVTDRRRNEFDVSANFTPLATFGFGVTYSGRDHDFDSDVRPVQPLAGTTFAAAPGVTPGIQLGLLNQETSRLAFDANWTPSERFGANAFVSFDTIDVFQRNMAYNENARISAQPPQLASPGQAWTDARSIWSSDTRDETRSFGVGVNYAFIPERLTLTADYVLSDGSVRIAYDGYGSTQPLTTTYYAWRSPEDVENVLHTANLGLEYQLPRGFMIGFRYLYEDFETKDWMLEPIGGWVEVVNDYFLRDSTRDNRWGNRIPRLNGYFAPSYAVNVGSVTVGYRW